MDIYGMTEADDAVSQEQALLRVHCPQCQYPYEGSGCPNPACPADKGGRQLTLIKAAQEARKVAAEYDREHKGIDYSLSFKKEKP